jgi:hypothetical protein
MQVQLTDAEPSLETSIVLLIFFRLSIVYTAVYKVRGVWQLARDFNHECAYIAFCNKCLHVACCNLYHVFTNLWIY